MRSSPMNYWMHARMCLWSTSKLMIYGFIDFVQLFLDSAFHWCFDMHSLRPQNTVWTLTARKLFHLTFRRALRGLISVSKERSTNFLFWIDFASSDSRSPTGFSTLVTFTHFKMLHCWAANRENFTFFCFWWHTKTHTTSKERKQQRNGAERKQLTQRSGTTEKHQKLLFSRIRVNNSW